MVPTLLAQHAPSDPVAFGAGGERTATALRQDAGRVHEALGEVVAEAPYALLVFRHDRYAFAAALWGALVAGYRPLLPADTGRETVLALAQRADTGTVLHDTLSGAPLRVDRLLETAPGASVPLAPLPEDRAARLQLVRSDGRGDFVAVERSLESLLQEADSVAEALAVRADSRLCGAVSPGHPYALVASLLAPLLRGAAFQRDMAGADTLAATRETPPRQAVWVSVPRDLAGLGEAQTLPSLSRLVCSTAALDPGTRARLEARLDAPITELLGDAQAGLCLARQGTATAFQPLPDVAAKVEADGHLTLRAPWLADDVRTAELVSPSADDGFESLGREDDWLTLEGERLSRAHLEASLCETAEVHDAALWAPAQGPHAGRCVVAVVAPSLQPEALAAHIERALPPAARPARWLSLERIPRDSLGALMPAALLRRFELRPDGSSLCLELEWQAERVQHQEGAQLSLTPVRVPDDYAYFDGHFPGYPILPGAAQLGELVLPCVRRARPTLGALRKMTRLKFLGRITPGATVEVELRWQSDAAAVDFTLRSQTETCAAGRLNFALETGP